MKFTFEGRGWVTWREIADQRSGMEINQTKRKILAEE